MNVLFSLLSGIWGYVAAAVFAAGLASAGTYFVEHSIEEKKVSDLKTSIANQKADNATQALAQLSSFISRANLASADYSTALDGINARFAALTQGFKDATRKPLPVDCRPDAGRVSILAAAIAAANAKNTPAAK